MAQQQLIETHNTELKKFEDLIKTKNYLPQNIDKVLLLRYLNHCDNDVQKAENLIYKNLKLRKKNPALFKNRDVLDDDFKETRKICQVFPMPKPTPDGYEIVIFRLVDRDPSKFVPRNVLRTNVSMLDAKFITDNEIMKGSLAIIDLTGFSCRHFMKNFTNFSMFNNYGKFIHQVTPWKPVGFHIVNCPAILKRVMSFLGPRVRRNYMELANFYDDYERVGEKLPKEYIPNEFGGSAGSIDDLHNDWVKVLESKRDYILNDDNWKLGDQ